MRAFISVCALAAVAAAAGNGNSHTGNYEYHGGGSDWYDIYHVTNDVDAAVYCKKSATSKQSPINFDCATEKCQEDEALSVSPKNYGKSALASVTKLDDGYHPAVNMQVGFPTTPTRDGSWWTGKAAPDDDKNDEDNPTDAEKARLHAINEAWFKVEGNCDDDCKAAGVTACTRDFRTIDAQEKQDDYAKYVAKMKADKDYCNKHEYKWAPYALSYINSQVIYKDWPNDLYWGPNARADVWGTDFFSDDQGAVNFLATPGQMHIHTPSEHQFNGKNYDAEIHWVHYTMVDGAPNFSVIGYMFDIDDGDASGNTTMIDELLKTYNAQSPDKYDPSKGEPDEDDNSFNDTNDANDPEYYPMIDFGKFFSDVDTVNFYHYEGSFTTPPCTEGVKFYIMKQIQPLTSKQLENIKRYTESYTPNDKEPTSDHPAENAANPDNAAGNNREIQPLNGRTIYMSVDPSQSNAMALLAMVSPFVALLAF